MSSRPEQPPAASGRQRSGRLPATRASAPQRPPAQYEPYLDGLFTYCLSVLCDHDAAVGALGEVLAFAERQSRRRPADPAQRRPWLYSLARWACLCRLSQQQDAQRSKEERRADPPPIPEDTAQQRRRELAALAWPEAAGTSPEQREALELVVRHRLPPAEVAAVLGMEREAARRLLASAACEVERTRAALAVVERGQCSVVARLTGDHQVLLGVALRRELVRHVDDCPDCRRTAERAGAGWAWPGSAPDSAAGVPLPVLPAPRAAAQAAMVRALRTRPLPPPRYDRRGFPRDPRRRAARRSRVRGVAVTSTVVATVVAAPVLALWAAYFVPSSTGEPEGFPMPDSGAKDEEPLDGRAVGRAGGDHPGSGAPRFAVGGGSPDVSVEVVDDGGIFGDHAGHSPGHGPAIGPGRLTVEAYPSGDLTLITLRASGGSAVHWRATSPAQWLTFSRAHGVLRPGESTTIVVGVNDDREPPGAWTAQLAIAPGDALIRIGGRGAWPPSSPDPGPGPGKPPPDRSHPVPSPRPSTPPPRPDPSASNTPPPPDPTPSDSGSSPPPEEPPSPSE